MDSMFIPAILLTQRNGGVDSISLVTVKKTVSFCFTAPKGFLKKSFLLLKWYIII